MNKALNPNEFYTYKDYLQWPEDERWELIDGIPFNMTPAPSANHQRVSREFLTSFNNYLKGKNCEVFNAPFDVRLPRSSENDEDTSTVLQPDLCIICDPKKIDRRGCVGGPDLVVEIASPGTLARDMKHKVFCYEAARVREYWIVQPEGKTVLVYQLSADNHYERPRVFTSEDMLPVGIFSDFELNLEEIFSVISEDE